MKLKLITLVLCSTFSLPTVFAADTQNTSSTNQSTSTTNQQTNTTGAQNNNTQKNQMDGQILAVLVVLNQNEISAADLVSKKKGVNSSVASYAKMLSKEHNKNLKETLKLSRKIGAPVQNDTANSLKQHGENELATLNPLSGAALNKAYIDAMVNDHNAAIQLFDNTLIPNAGNKKLKEHLTSTRKHLVKHLKDAQAIQKKLDKQTNDNSATNSSNTSDTTGTSNSAQ
ncbi:Predicted outer membrane protein [Legionella beliardensis]|uniref:Predicted outer membrane protein n=1 Tax=Legionella beliardensis TaxID=91822 RepID=A0A378I0C8_9GAMM|nr:DUF4142 domain-containing protein [Legionella beliardensis]STX28201.1 Predicted outer membrane protein [Legionella beliardensis]